MEAMTLHWYPNYIIDPIHKMRSMKIIVKENASFDGIRDKFKQDLDKKSNETNEIINNSANLWKSGKKVSDINTTNIDKNTKRITQADPIYACALPLPNELLDSQSHRQEMENGLMGALIGANADKIGSSIVKKFNLDDKVKAVSELS